MHVPYAGACAISGWGTRHIRAGHVPSQGRACHIRVGDAPYWGLATRSPLPLPQGAHGLRAAFARPPHLLLRLSMQRLFGRFRRRGPRGRAQHASGEAILAVEPIAPPLVRVGFLVEPPWLPAVKKAAKLVWLRARQDVAHLHRRQATRHSTERIGPSAQGTAMSIGARAQGTALSVHSAGRLRLDGNAADHPAS
eukprot:1179124-Prymnesium_polylepis.2